jgi:hypothetical protein
MKSHNYRFAAILILAVSLLPFSISGFGAGQLTPDQTRLMPLMKVDQSLEKALGKDVLEKAKGSLAQQIAADFEAMKLLFEAKDFCCLAKLLGKRGAALTTPGYEKICGGGSAEFWQSVWKDGLELNFVPVSIVVSGAITPQPVPLCTLIDQGSMIKDEKGNPIYYNAVAILTLEFHIVPKVKGEASHNATGMGTATYFHKTVCPWG